MLSSAAGFRSSGNAQGLHGGTPRHVHPRFGPGAVKVHFRALGGSGFIGGHCIVQLLAAGHQVRTTVRDLTREGEVLTVLKEGGVEPGSRLSFAAAGRGLGGGCDYVLHVASPFPSGAPRHEDELLIPAREGALRVLRASRDAGVKRVVLTSSFAAIGYGHPPGKTLFPEADWTDPQRPGVGASPKSKTLAERAAWDFLAREPSASGIAGGPSQVLKGTALRHRLTWAGTSGRTAGRRSPPRGAPAGSNGPRPGGRPCPGGRAPAPSWGPPARRRGPGPSPRR